MEVFRSILISKNIICVCIESLLCACAGLEG